MFVLWSASLETGQTLIDAEHRILVFLFRKLDVAVKTGQSQMAINQIISEVKRCAEFHFVSEENIMRETNYPHLLVHQGQHSDLLVKLGALATKVAARREFPEDLLFFLSSWLTEHISQYDQHAALHISDSVDRPVAEDTYGEYIVSTRSKAA
ncbi:MAG: hemerythrin family protein [Caldimonas sp.]